MTASDVSTATLLISHDVVGDAMAGPGIRYFHLARVLAKHVDVTLAVPDGSSREIPADGFEVVHFRSDDWSTLQPHVQRARTCVFPSVIADAFPALADSDVCRVIDGYDPLLAEWLSVPGSPDDGVFTADWQKLMLQLNRQYVMGDFFLCASERQRDWWLGLLEANGRINPATHRKDPSLRNLIDVVAYGLPEHEPVHTRQIVKGVWDGISPDDKLLVWGGGLWPWLDPVTAVRAVAQVAEQRSDVRLIFPGTRHPNPILYDMPTALQDTRRIAQDLGLTDSFVSFGDWVPYQDWSSLLLECDVALTLHHDTLETRLAFRSRVLEYIWCSLPIVATRGDATSELVDQYGLGIVVDYEDVDAVAGAILRLLDEGPGARADAFAAAHQELTWEKLALPLINYCQNPSPAADRRSEDTSEKLVYLPNPWEHLRHERAYWQARVDAYERGRFIRTMNWINRQTNRFRPGADNSPSQPPSQPEL